MYHKILNSLFLPLLLRGEETGVPYTLLCVTNTFLRQCGHLGMEGVVSIPRTSRETILPLGVPYRGTPREGMVYPTGHVNSTTSPSFFSRSNMRTLKEPNKYRTRPSVPRRRNGVTDGHVLFHVSDPVPVPGPPPHHHCLSREVRSGSF